MFVNKMQNISQQHGFPKMFMAWYLLRKNILLRLISSKIPSTYIMFSIILTSMPKQRSKIVKLIMGQTTFPVVQHKLGR